MVRRLDMHKTQGIEHLFSTGMSKRKIARTLGIDRKSVDRHLAEIQSKGAISQEAPIGEAPTATSSSGIFGLSPEAHYPENLSGKACKGPVLRSLAMIRREQTAPPPARSFPNCERSWTKPSRSLAKKANMWSMLHSIVWQPT